MVIRFPDEHWASGEAGDPRGAGAHPPEVELPPGYWLKWGGQFENQQQAIRRLGRIIALLLVTFSSLWAAG